MELGTRRLHGARFATIGCCRAASGAIVLVVNAARMLRPDLLFVTGHADIAAAGNGDLKTGWALRPPRDAP